MCSFVKVVVSFKQKYNENIDAFAMLWINKFYMLRTDNFTTWITEKITDGHYLDILLKYSQEIAVNNTPEDVYKLIDENLIFNRYQVKDNYNSIHKLAKNNIITTLELSGKNERVKKFEKATKTLLKTSNDIKIIDQYALNNQEALKKILDLIRSNNEKVNICIYTSNRKGNGKLNKNYVNKLKEQISNEYNISIYVVNENCAKKNMHSRYIVFDERILKLDRGVCDIQGSNKSDLIYIGIPTGDNKINIRNCIKIYRQEQNQVIN